jgi:hypothetical protein
MREIRRAVVAGHSDDIAAMTASNFTARLPL